jgi:hypothetical protein
MMTNGRIPIVWLARPVIEAITASATLGDPHQVGGQLLGFWVVPYWEAVVTDFNDFASSMFRALSDDQTAVPEYPRRLGTEQLSDAMRQPCGSWIIARQRTDQSERVHACQGTTRQTRTGLGGCGPSLLLVLDEQEEKRVRAWMSPRRRWPWEIFRRPKEADVRAFVHPRT